MAQEQPFILKHLVSLFFCWTSNRLIIDFVVKLYSFILPILLYIY